MNEKKTSKEGEQEAPRMQLKFLDRLTKKSLGMLHFIAEGKKKCHEPPGSRERQRSKESRQEKYEGKDPKTEAPLTTVKKY